MSITLGPSTFWIRTKEAADYFAVRCPVGTTLGDRSKIFCKTGGRAWITASSATEVVGCWATGIQGTVCGDLCCITPSTWSTLYNALVSNGNNPSDWFVPTVAQLQTAYVCRTNWDYVSTACYWSSNEVTGCVTCTQTFAQSINTSGTLVCVGKICCLLSIRAMRCVTY